MIGKRLCKHQNPQNPFQPLKSALSGAACQLSLKGELKTREPRKCTPFGAAHHLSPDGGTGPMGLMKKVGS